MDFLIHCERLVENVGVISMIIFLLYKIMKIEIGYFSFQSATESCEPDHETDTYYRYSSAEEFGLQEDLSPQSSEEGLSSSDSAPDQPDQPATQPANNENDNWDGSDILRSLDPRNIAAAMSTMPDVSGSEEPTDRLARLSQEIIADQDRVSDFTRSYPNALIAWNSTPAPPPASVRQQRRSMPEPVIFQAQAHPPRPVVTAVSEAVRPTSFNRVPGAERVRNRAVPSRRLSMPANPVTELEPLMSRLDLPNISEEEEAAPMHFTVGISDPSGLDNSLLDVGSEVEIYSEKPRFSPFNAPPNYNVDLDASENEEDMVSKRFEHFGRYENFEDSNPSASSFVHGATPALTDLLPRGLAEDLQITTLGQGASLSAVPIIGNNCNQRRSMDPSRKRMVQEVRVEVCRPPKSRRSGVERSSSPNDSFGESSLLVAAMNEMRVGQESTPDDAEPENTLDESVDEVFEAETPLEKSEERRTANRSSVRRWLQTSQATDVPVEQKKCHE